MVAGVAAQRHFIGWLRFNLGPLPNMGQVTEATLNLTTTQTTGTDPEMVVEYATFDGWVRRTASISALVVTSAMSETFGKPSGGRNGYTLYVGQKHDWQADLLDGTLTIGVDNLATTATGETSQVEFPGVNHAMLGSEDRPTLDLVLCR